MLARRLEGAVSSEEITSVLTPRLRLRRLEEADRLVIRRMDTDPEIMGAAGVRTAEESDRFVADQIAHWERHGFGVWMAIDRVTQVCVGRGGLRHITLGGQDVVQVGYGLFPGFWGQGLATEVAVASIRVAFDLLRLPRLVAIVLPVNLASRRVLVKVGFTPAGDTLYDGATHMLYERRGAAAAAASG
jgi:RimJ/RimL family protein N-acetyltransferase